MDDEFRRFLSDICRIAKIGICRLIFEKSQYILKMEVDFPGSTLENVCRTCLLSGKNFFSLFDSIRLDNQEHYLNTILTECTTLEVKDGDNSTKICSNCFEKLTQAYTFKLQCLEANMKLQAYCSRPTQSFEETESLLQEDIEESKEVTQTTQQNTDADFITIDDCDVTEKLKNCDNTIKVSEAELNNDGLLLDKATSGTSFETEEKKFPCSVCNRIFSHKYTMHRHLKIHSGDNNLKCEICFKQFSRRTDVKRHMTLHTGERPYNCLVCSATFTQSSTLARHIRKHDEYRIIELQKIKQETSNLCSICGKSFKSSNSLTIHIRRHTGDKPYQCKTCHMSFVTRGRLTCHSRVHTGERPFICKVCGKSFAQSSVIGKHMKIHNGERKYVCTMCNKGFRTLYYLNIHKRIHTGEKPEQCTVCFKRFADPKVLKRHQKTHTGEKPLLCNVCGKNFGRYHHLRTHMKTHKS